MVSDPTIANAVFYRIIHTVHTTELYAENIRKLRFKKNQRI